MSSANPRVHGGSGKAYPRSLGIGERVLYVIYLSVHLLLAKENKEEEEEEEEMNT